MDSVQTILRSAKHFFCATFLSRLSGFFRDMAMAFCFGSSAEAAAFLVAFRLSNLFRRVLGEGNLQAGFVPQFESFRQQSFEKAFHFYRETALFLTLLSLLFVAGSELILWAILPLLSPSWKQIVLLAMWMFPGLLFICLSGLNQALLQSQKRYFLSAATPIVFNVVWIVAAIYASDMTTLAIWVTMGSFLQWILSSFQVKQEFAGQPKFRRNPFSSDCLKLAGLLTLGLVGIAASQINSALDAIFARVADLSGPVYLWYAVRLQQLPVALFGLALSGALLPPLSRAIQTKDRDRFYDFLESSLRRGAVLIIPSAFALIALGDVGINLLYGHGHFHMEDVRLTFRCLWAYAIGLIPSVYVLLLSQAFYAKSLYTIPAKASCISVVLNIILNAFFVFVCKWGAMSVALATSLSSILNCYLLIRSLEGCCSRPLVSLAFRLSAASGLATSVTLFVQRAVFPELAVHSWDQGIQFVVLGLTYLSSLLGLSYFFSIREVKEILAK